MQKICRLLGLGIMAMLVLGCVCPTNADDCKPVFTCRYLSSAKIATITGVSWRPGCPVAIKDLRLVEVSYWDFHGKVKTGEIIVHATVAKEVREIFRELYECRYPIARIQLVDDFGADDTKSMAADNTSAFNFRKISGSTKLSMHSYGVAIDLNPIENPYVKGKVIDPPQGKAFVDRKLNAPGMIKKGDPAHQAFVSRGWSWGGDWENSKDYQHFEKPLK